MIRYTKVQYDQLYKSTIWSVIQKYNMIRYTKVQYDQLYKSTISSVIQKYNMIRYTKVQYDPLYNKYTMSRYTISTLWVVIQ